MSSYSAANGVHKTLAADTVDDVTLSGGDGPTHWLRVTNRGAGTISYVWGYTAPSNPTKLGDDTWSLPSGSSDRWDLSGDEPQVIVKLISGSADDYSVEAS